MENIDFKAARNELNMFFDATEARLNSNGLLRTSMTWQRLTHHVLSPANPHIEKFFRQEYSETSQTLLINTAMYVGNMLSYDIEYNSSKMFELYKNSVIDYLDTFEKLKNNAEKLLGV